MNARIEAAIAAYGPLEDGDYLTPSRVAAALAAADAASLRDAGFTTLPARLESLGNLLRGVASNTAREAAALIEAQAREIERLRIRMK